MSTILASSPVAFAVGLPLLLAALAAFAVSVLASFRVRTDWVRGVGLSGTVMVGLALVQLIGRDGADRYGPLRFDDFTLWVGLLAVSGAAFGQIAIGSHLRRFGTKPGPAIALFSAGSFGALIACFADDLLILVVGLEIVHVAGVALVAGTRLRGRTVDGTVRYALLGGAATAFLLLGVGFVYHATGTMQLDALSAPPDSTTGRIALALLLVGLAIRLGAAPFHAWVPDTHEGSPTPATTFLVATGTSVSLLALVRVLDTPLAAMHRELLVALIGAMAMLSMLIGHLVALVQNNVKRMIAYATIGQVGFVLLGLLTPEAAGGAASAMLALTAWMPAVLGASLVLVLIGRDREDLESVESLKGLGREHPWIGAALMLFLLSMIGLPGTAGFIGKLAVLQGATRGGHELLALVGVVATVISAAYCLHVIRELYLPPAQHQWFAERDRYGIRFLVAIAAVATLVLGFAPDLLASGLSP